MTPRVWRFWCLPCSLSPFFIEMCSLIPRHCHWGLPELQLNPSGEGLLALKSFLQQVLARWHLQGRDEPGAVPGLQPRAGAALEIEAGKVNPGDNEYPGADCT